MTPEAYTTLLNAIETKVFPTSVANIKKTIYNSIAAMQSTIIAGYPSLAGRKKRMIIGGLAASANLFLNF